ncbi:GntR family transcriptional regulator [Aromatoleum aromaticum]|uniref:Transcriptional regulator, GntR family n=1 Tax=Aromatoleum aromaticum (strain DSM 19018 / LMG 30748 / EbN1) TaxID=76114 RepID=Q5P605_AROAE|nr:GntR family transcriptional regulator [Aromatoleum aromaticum]NMG54289.1 GntR family transcriptional regulator [Aromatoleum aromaticum]CAI07256.1 Transcriptional regulator, GntR family [Aromatoleum aromaticum EbN1]
MVPSLKPVERPLALGEQVYHKLRSHLRNGMIVAGQPLQEVQLAEQLGVSRTPVREALRRLSSEGLLVSDGRSFVVPALTLDDVNDIYEIRFLVETAAIRRIAAFTQSPAMRRSIDDALAAAMRAHEANDADAFREANISFRAAWLALVPNPRLVRIVEQYADHMQRIRTLTLGDAQIRTIVLRGLNRITAALAVGDGDTAAAAMLEHLGEAKRSFIAAVGLADEDPQHR